jgi:hypothetical protein
VVLLPVPLFGIGGLAIAAVLIAALLFWRSAPTIASAWSSVPMTWVGRAPLTAVGVAGAIALSRDVIAIL